MQTKKLVLLSSIVFTLLLLAGCGKKTETQMVTPEEWTPIAETTTVETTTVETTTKTVPATKSQCLELVVYGMKVALLQGKWNTASATKLAQEASDLEKKYISSKIEYEESCGMYMIDQQFVQEVQKRVAEVQ